jgi:hypothetical protein
LNSNGKLNLSIGNPYIVWVEEWRGCFYDRI